jgi:hypothetical protein
MGFVRGLRLVIWCYLPGISVRRSDDRQVHELDDGRYRLVVDAGIKKFLWGEVIHPGRTAASLHGYHLQSADGSMLEVQDFEPIAGGLHLHNPEDGSTEYLA